MPRREQLLASFAGNMSVLLGAGITAADALQELASSHPQEDFAATLAAITSEVQNGRPLSEVLTEKTVFDNYFVAVVASAEQAGQLQNGFSMLARELNEQDQLLDEIRSAFTYPIFLVVTCLVSLFFIFALVIPQLTPIFYAAQGSLPFSVRLLIGIAGFMQNWGLPLLSLLLITVGVLFLIRGQIDWRGRLTALLVFIPRFRTELHRLELAHFFKTMASLLNAGLTQLDAVQTAKTLMQSSLMRQHAERVEDRLIQGHRFSNQLAQIECAPQLLITGLIHAERAGQLPAALSQAAVVLNDDFRSFAKRTTQLLEPTLIVLMGLIIGFVVFVVFSSLQALNSSVL